MPGSKARSSTVVGGGERGRGTGREGLELERRRSGKWKKTHGFSRRRGLVDRFQLSSFETARERETRLYTPEFGFDEPRLDLSCTI